MMKIIPLRDMLLSGRPVEQGVATTVSEADGHIALRNGWATEAVAERAAPSKSDKHAKGEKD